MLLSLGYKGVYHMREVFINEDHPQRWVSALEAKFEGKGKPYGRAEFDEILGNYMVAHPAFDHALFSSPLLSYPFLFFLYSQSKVNLQYVGSVRFPRSPVLERAHRRISISQSHPLRPR